MYEVPLRCQCENTAMHDVKVQITVSVNSPHHENLTTCEFPCVGNTRRGERTKLKSSSML